MLSATLGCIGFSWIASPVCTELEMKMMDWLAEALNLPDKFRFDSSQNGGGVIQGTASEATIVAMLTARNETLKRLSLSDQQTSTSPYTNTKHNAGQHHELIAYCSELAHSSCERATLLANVKLRLIETDDRCSMRADKLEEAIRQDLANNMIPFIVIATLGTTAVCSYDDIKSISMIARQHSIWVHVDAAYAGSALVCPELRMLMPNLNYADSFDFNPHKWLQVNFDCSAFYISDSRKLVNAFNVDPVYLRHENQGKIPDYRHWQLPLGRRFRSLKLWFVMRLFGINKLQSYIRRHVDLARYFEYLLSKDSRFELTHKTTLGLVCFRLKVSIIY